MQPKNGARGQVSKQTNVVPFPLTVRGVRPLTDNAGSPSSYEFTEGELAALCRWFSAMKYAFPGTEGVMMVNHQESYSAVGLRQGQQYSIAGRLAGGLLFQSSLW